MNSQKKPEEERQTPNTPDSGGKAPPSLMYGMKGVVLPAAAART